MHFRTDEELPIFRLDAFLEKASPIVLKDILKDPHTMPQWLVRGKNSAYNHCVQGKLLRTESDGTEVFQNFFKSLAPLKQWSVVYRRQIYNSIENDTYSLFLSSKGLEHLGS